jgi:transposase
MERLAMSQTKEILRLRWAVRLSVRETARATKQSTGVVSKTVTRAERAGLTWALVDELGEADLEQRLYGPPRQSIATRAEPDPVWIHRELRRTGVTLELLHLEYLAAHPDGFRYTAFCDRYRAWHSRTGIVMRQVHRAGEKGFVDYSGKKPHFIDPTTGETIEVELFVGVLGASNRTYAEATLTQQVADFIGSHVRMYAYFGGAPRMTVPDQLRSAVSVPCRYEPTINRTYAELGRHYGTAIVPARPRKPRDKAKVEVAVQVAQRWILARIRNETFFSLVSLNARIAELLEDLNARPMKRLGGVSRHELFERYDRHALLPLPAEPYVISEWRGAKVAPDYHVALDEHYYSVPYTLCGEDVEARLTGTTVEVFRRGRRVASHVRSDEKYRHTTCEEHMPEAHRAVFEGGEALTEWAASVGPMCAALVKRIFESNFHREVGWRSCKGLQRLAGKYGPERVERGSAHALVFGARSYKPVERLLKLGRESLPLPGEEETERAPIAHQNVRGPDYYH